MRMTKHLGPIDPVVLHMKEYREPPGNNLKTILWFLFACLIVGFILRYG